MLTAECQPLTAAVEETTPLGTNTNHHQSRQSQNFRQPAFLLQVDRQADLGLGRARSKTKEDSGPGLAHRAWHWRGDWIGYFYGHRDRDWRAELRYFFHS